VRKVSSTGPQSTVVFVYDQAGHLLGEYDQNGAALREYVWLRDTPMAMFTPDPANPSGEPLVYFIHTDHLNTPRVVVDRQNRVRWRWLAEPFGTSAPETNPEGLGVFVQNLRFPGQYADQESGLWYNYHRYYNSAGGQYTQSDPIGLAGGINTYAYVRGNPLSLFDHRGLAVSCRVIFWLLVANIEICEEDGKTPSEQDAKSAVRMNDKQLQKACKANGYEDAHALKRDLGLDSKYDIFSDKNGNMYSGPRQGTGIPQYLHMNTSGIPPSP